MKESIKSLAQRNERLRLHRIGRNWRQQDVADQLGIAVTTMQRWERGNQQPSAYYRAKLCTLFGLSAQELGLVEEAPSSSIPSESEDAETEAQDGASPCREEIRLWTIPYGRNPHFTGREDLLAHLEHQFSTDGFTQPTTLRQAALTQAQAIKGLGGIGKTQIAVEYAYRARVQDRYSHTIWINAASEEAILTSFASLADFLLPVLPQDQSDQRKLVTAVLHWLEDCSEPWLLIMDNADDLPLVQPYLPRQGNGHILLTTRASAVGSLALAVEVDSMGVIEGTHLLLHRAQRLAAASDEEINEASNLAVQLGQFPLALDQAGAYIEETGCSVSDYLQLYQQHRHALLARRGKQVTRYPDSVATTWSLSFERVEQSNPAAAELLRLCALLSPDHIPEELLIEGAPYWPPALQQAVADRFTFNHLLETLLAFSLIKRLSEDHLLSIHRLVQVVQIERMEAEEQCLWARRLIRAMNSVFPRNPEDPAATWSICQRYLEQVQACDTLIQQYQLLLPEAAEVLDRTGTYLRECALYNLAGPLYERALGIREQLLGPEHADTAETLNNLAGLYWWQSKYPESEALYQRALRILEQELGPEHPKTAQTLNDLAVLYYQLSRYTEAKLLYERALRILERELGPEHPKTAQTLNDLAILYCQLGNYAEAESLYLRALHIREQQRGPEHSDTAETLNNLALLYYERSRYREAEPLYLRVLRIWEQQMGPEHPFVAHILVNLAMLYYYQGKYVEVEPLFHRALRIYEQQLGTEYHEVAWPLYGLALLYDKQGKAAVEIEPLFLRALRIREQQSGPHHPETARILHDFAGFQQAHGNMSEAVSMYQRAFIIREHALGADHPLTIKTHECLHAVQEIL